MPATALQDPPGIRCVFSDGTTAAFRLEGLPCPRLVGDLLTGLAELVHPHGSIDAANSVELCLPPIRNMARGLAARGFSGGAAQLRRGLLIQYWMATRRFRWEGFTRRMLRLPPYSETEWERLTAACRMVVEESYIAHRRALAAAAGGKTPTVEEWTSANLAWLLGRLGPVGTPGVAAHLGCSVNAVQKRGGVPAASAGMFPHLSW